MNNSDIQAEAVATLRKLYGVKAGSTIHTSVVHVSRSGMSRTIKAYVTRSGHIYDVSWLVADAIGATRDRDRGGVKLQGCGMDMTFHLVYSLGEAMFPKGTRCTGNPKTCRSNDHSNDYNFAWNRARRELEAEGVDTFVYADDVERKALHATLRARAELITERDGLTYRKGRKHSDGGYALRNINV